MSAVKEVTCSFCKRGRDAEPVCGKLHTGAHHGKIYVAHHRCMQYSALLIQYKCSDFGGFKISKVRDEMFRARCMKCAVCLQKVRSRGPKINPNGASAGCAISKCNKTFHLYCARLDPTAVTIRTEVEQDRDNKRVLYRVFCSDKHKNVFLDGLTQKGLSVTPNTPDSDDDDNDNYDNNSDAGSDIVPESHNHQKAETQHTTANVSTHENSKQGVVRQRHPSNLSATSPTHKPNHKKQKTSSHTKFNDTESDSDSDSSDELAGSDSESNLLSLRISNTEDETSRRNHPPSQPQNHDQLKEDRTTLETNPAFINAASRKLDEHKRRMIRHQRWKENNRNLEGSSSSSSQQTARKSTSSSPRLILVPDADNSLGPRPNSSPRARHLGAGGDHAEKAYRVDSTTGHKDLLRKVILYLPVALPCPHWLYRKLMTIHREILKQEVTDALLWQDMAGVTTGFTTEYLPHYISSIVQTWLKDDMAELADLLTDPQSNRCLEKYQNLVTFQNKCDYLKDEFDSGTCKQIVKVVEKILERYPEGKPCDVMKVDDYLILMMVMDDVTDSQGIVRRRLLAKPWSPLFPLINDDKLELSHRRTAEDDEDELDILKTYFDKVLKNNKFSFYVRPVERDILCVSEDSCPSVVWKFAEHLETLLAQQDSKAQVTAKVLCVTGVDESVVNYKVYLEKVVADFVLSWCKEVHGLTMYIVADLKSCHHGMNKETLACLPNSEARDNGLDVRLYTIIDPKHRRATCIVMKFSALPKKEISIPTSRDAASASAKIKTLYEQLCKDAEVTSPSNQKHHDVHTTTPSSTPTSRPHAENDENFITPSRSHDPDDLMTLTSRKRYIIDDECPSTSSTSKRNRLSVKYSK